MENRKNLEMKRLVRDKYTQIAQQCTDMCGCGCATTKHTEYSVFNEDYKNIPGYYEDADLSLGCGLPVQYAGIKPGASVLDLGSGAGNDCFVVRYMVGDKGKVTGLDFSSEMINRARANNKKLGYSNVEFIMGDIENMPLSDGSYHIVISNCVLNLVPDKIKAFTEIYRVLIRGGHFCISDVVIKGDLPQRLREDAEMYAGCISGALDKNKYLDVIKAAGFTNIQILTEKRISLPETILLKFFTADQLAAFQKTGNGIFSITLMAEK